MESIEQMIKRLCPKGVEWKSFSEIGSYIRGITYNKAQENNTGDGEGWKVFRANNITLSSNTLNYDDVKVVQRSVKVKEIQMLKEHDILICAGSGSKDHIGKVAYINKDMDYTFGGFMGVLRADESLVLSRYLFHVFTSKIFKDYLSETLNSSTINNLNSQIMNDFEFPLPPLCVQERLVEVLDKMTTLTAELEAELEARKQQYEYYRNKLLTFNEIGAGNRFVKLGDVCELGTGSHNTQDGLIEGLYPFYTRGIDILFLNEYDYDETAIVTAGDGAGVGKVIHFVKGKYSLHQRAYRIVADEQQVLAKYVYHYMKATFYNYIIRSSVSSSVTSVRKPMLYDYPIPIPPLSEQQRIVSILDRFEALTTDLQSGLPAEIEARRQQYEYYRNKLLSFEAV